MSNQEHPLHFGPETSFTRRGPGHSGPLGYPQGTIKVSLTERLLQLFLLARKVSAAGDAAVLDGARRWRGEVVAHELMHAWQFHTGPVRDLSHGDAFHDGLPDPALLAEAGKKVEDEHQGGAFSAGQKAMVAAQYELPKAVLELHRLNEQGPSPAAREERARIEARWKEFRAEGEMGEPSR